MKHFDIILFDLDGTLTDPKEGIQNSIQYALRKMDLPELKDSELLTFIGPPIQRSFAELCHLSDEEVVLAVHFYREYFKGSGMIENNVYDEIPELLHEMKEAGKSLFVATSKPTVFAIEILKHFQLDQYFTEIVGSNLDGTRIDKKEILDYICDKYSQFSKSKMVMIGDRYHDVIGAKLMNIQSIGVTYGYGTKDELVNAGANYIANSVKDLRELIVTDRKVKSLIELEE